MDANGRMGQSIIQTEKQEPSPFSARMVKRESDTSHSNTTSDGECIFNFHTPSDTLYSESLMLPWRIHLRVIHLRGIERF